MIKCVYFNLLNSNDLFLSWQLVYFYFIVSIVNYYRIDNLLFNFANLLENIVYKFVIWKFLNLLELDEPVSHVATFVTNFLIRKYDNLCESATAIDYVNIVNILIEL